MKHTASTRIASLLVMLAATVPGWGVEHPGVVPADADCASCHVKKISGKSVHSAMSTSCTVCHVARTQGDMTSLSLAMPKEQICFACHENRRTQAARAGRERIMPGVSRCAQQRPRHAAAIGGRTAGFGS